MSRSEGPADGHLVAEDPVTARVRAFYEHVRFPGVRFPDQDGLILMRRLAERASRDPAARSTGQFRVLDAGCGTGNTGLSLARRFPDIEFVGLDISLPSLDVARAVAEREGIENIRFRQADLMRPIAEGQRFDTVLCLGVLHHTADPRTVLSNLREVLKDDGEIYLWVYGIHGRYRHSLNRSLLGMLLDAGPAAGEEVRLALELIETPGTGEAIRSDLMSPGLERSVLEQLLHNPSWIADQFLNPREVLLDMKALLELIEGAGFTFSRWLGVKTDISSHFSSPELIARFNAMPAPRRLAALDLLLKPERYFILAQSART